MSEEQLNQLINVVASITLFEMMVAIGLGVTLAELLQVAKDWRVVSMALIASYVCVPAAAVALLILFQADPLVAAGFLIVAVCPGAPFGPPLTALAKGNVAVSVGLMVILAATSAIAAPVLLGILMPLVLSYLPAGPEEGSAVTIDGNRIAITLLVAQFLPLCLGLALRQWRPAVAQRLLKPANRISLVLNLLTLGLIVFAQFDMLVKIPLRGYFGMFLLVSAGVAAGWLLSSSANRSAMVMGTSVRNVGVALVIVSAAFAGTTAVMATTAFALFQTLLIALFALAWGQMIKNVAVSPPLDTPAVR